MGSPSGRVLERAPERFLVATEACGGGTTDLLCSRSFLGIWVYIGGRNTSGEPQGAHEGGGHAQGGGRAPLPRGLLEASLTSAPRLLDHVHSKNHAPEGFIPFGLRLIFIFFETLK